MLKRLHITNFRSIQDAEIHFADSGLLVLIGANGSGKSNLIKFLDFLGSIARDGLYSALYSQKSREALLPKVLSESEVAAARTTFEYDFELWRPKWFPGSEPALTVQHEMVLGPSEAEIARLVSERLAFTSPLLAQYYADLLHKRPRPESSLGELRDSSFEIRRTTAGELAFSTTPSLEQHEEEFRRWLGLTFAAQSSTESKSAASARLLEIFRVLDSRPEVSADSGQRSSSMPTASLIMRKERGPLQLCAEADIFKHEIAEIRRYDFQLTELRREQESRPSAMLMCDGSGIPSVLRRIRSGRDDVGIAWRRLTTTLRAIAPHVVDASVSQLRSGKEFVEFFESKTGRPVESWEASDGTLRALAILLAVETHPNYGAILIEEPEVGLHPWAIQYLITHIREVIAERRIQAVVTTHSPQLLESVAPDEVSLVTRSPIKGTQFGSLRDAVPFGEVEMGDVGRLWMQGLLGGVPSAE